MVPAAARWSGAATAGASSLVLRSGEFVGVDEGISMGVLDYGMVC